MVAQSPIVQDETGKSIAATPVYSVNSAGVAGPAGSTTDPAYIAPAPYQYNVVSNSVAIAPMIVAPGTYSIAAAASSWAGGSVKLQFLLPDNVTYADLTTALTANSTSATPGFGSGGNNMVKAVITGSPVGLFVNIGRIGD